MCWSGEYSYAFAAAGVTGALCSQRWGGLPPPALRVIDKLKRTMKRSSAPPRTFVTEGHEAFRWMPLVYFSVMELLQGITYSVIGECGLPANTALTYLSYLHICFQPFFVNMFAMSWLGKEVRKGLSWVWPVCAFASLVMLMMLVSNDKWGTCDTARQMLCGADTCSYRGDWHIAWRLELNGLDSYYLVYWMSVFIVPIAYGSWRFVAYHFVLGPVLAWSLTGNKDERAAIWCLSSIAFLLATHVPAISRLLTARRKSGAPERT